MELIIEALRTAQPTSIIAMATTLHVAALLLRAHRNPQGRKFDALLLPSLAFAAAPWLFPTALGVGVGLAIHVLWFAACDRMIPTPSSEPVPKPASPPSQPSAVPARPAPRRGRGQARQDGRARPV